MQLVKDHSVFVILVILVMDFRATMKTNVLDTSVTKSAPFVSIRMALISVSVVMAFIIWKVMIQNATILTSVKIFSVIQMKNVSIYQENSNASA